MALLCLENDSLRIKADPLRGAGMVCFYRKTGAGDLPVMPDVESGGPGPDMACFLMVPYSNRIEKGEFTFEGKTYKLDKGEEHSLHGAVRHLPWQVVESGPAAALLRFDSKEHEKVNWPWPFAVEVAYELDGGVFFSSLKLWNKGESNMPGGVGWHPFFSRSLSKAKEPVYLQIDVPRVFPDENDNRIPSGPSEPVPPALEFSAEKPVDPDFFIDNCFVYRGGNGHLRWPASGIKAEFQCSSECSHLVFYNPPEPFFALEPVTNANNGVNLYEKGHPDSGIAVLPPGGLLQASYRIKVHYRKP